MQIVPEASRERLLDLGSHRITDVMILFMSVFARASESAMNAAMTLEFAVLRFYPGMTSRVQFSTTPTAAYSPFLSSEAGAGAATADVVLA